MKSLYEKIGAYLAMLSILFMYIQPDQLLAFKFNQKNTAENDSTLAQNENAQPIETECVAVNPCCISPWWGVAGGAILGAAAGAGVGAAVAGGRGDRGPTGATGAAGTGFGPGTTGFTLDGNTLTVTFPVALAVTALSAPGTVTYFVARPDGAVFQETVPFTVLGPIPAPAALVVPSVNGEYTIGFRIDGATGTIVTVGGAVLANVLASRDGSNTSVLIAAGASAAGVLTLLTGTASEATAGFVYGPAPNP